MQTIKELVEGTPDKVDLYNLGSALLRTAVAGLTYMIESGQGLGMSGWGTYDESDRQLEDDEAAMIRHRDACYAWLKADADDSPRMPNEAECAARDEAMLWIACNMDRLWD